MALNRKKPALRILAIRPVEAWLPTGQMQPIQPQGSVLVPYLSSLSFIT